MKHIVKTALLPLFLLTVLPSLAQTARFELAIDSESGRVIVTASQNVQEIRFRVFAPDGGDIYDSGFTPGARVEWNTLNRSGRPVPAGEYQSIITTKDSRGNLNIRNGVVTVLRQEQAKAAEKEYVSAVQQGVSAAAVSPGPISGGGTAGQVPMFTGANTIGDSLITENGGVGINTTTPGATLDVNGAMRIDNNNLSFFNTNLDSATPLFRMGESGNHSFQFQRLSPSANTKFFVVNSKGVAQGAFDFEGGSNFLTGSLGIGTTAPRQKLTVAGTIQSTSGGFMFPDGSTQTSAASGLGNVVHDGTLTGNGTNASPLAVTAGNASYIQNGTSGQVANFNIVGRGTVGNLVAAGNVVAGGNTGLATTNPLRTLQIGPSTDALFTLEPSDASPNAGYVRFGDHTGWKLHFGRSRENTQAAGGTLNTGTTGALMTIQDNGNIGIGTTTPQDTLDVRGNVKMGTSGQLFASGGEENLRIIRGYFDENGDIDLGSGFTVSHPGKGVYLLTFTTPFSAPPVVMTTCYFGDTTSCIINYDKAAANQIYLLPFKSNESGVDANQDATVNFIAIGPR